MPLALILLMTFIFNLQGCARGMNGAGGGLLLSSTSATTKATSSREENTPDDIDAEKAREITLKHFLDLRFDSIRRDAAAGGGENLDTLAELLQQDKAEFNPWMQTNYDFLFTQLTSPQQLLVRIKQLRQS